MFQDCKKQVCYHGTTYDANYVTKTYASTDKTDRPGYFTDLSAKVVVEDGGATLRFVCDGEDYGVRGTDWFSVLEAEELYPPWGDCWNKVETVVIAPTFQSYRPKRCDNWFYAFPKLKSFSGLQNLNVSATRSFNHMFGACTSLAELDLRAFVTTSAVDMTCMFVGCESLTNILATESFDVSAVPNSTAMFQTCVKLVGVKSPDKGHLNGRIMV